jgi:hypothetical protein
VLSRRSLLVAGGVGLSAGCLRLSGDDSTATSGDETTDDGGSDSDTTTDGTTNGGGGQSGRLQVVSASGLVGSSGDSVAMVSLVVKLAPGSGEIDLTTLSTEVTPTQTSRRWARGRPRRSRSAPRAATRQKCV